MIMPIEKETQREYMKSDTFRPTGEQLGMGCWGSVDKYTDPVGNPWAIKRFSPNAVALRQMEERGLTEEDVMRNEAVPLDGSAHHVVPRIIERDGDGKLYVGMPVFNDGTLEKPKKIVFRKFDGRKSTVDLDSIVNVVKDVADALGYIHNTHSRFDFQDDTYGTRKAHGDVKPSNILMKKNRAYLGDLGSSTCISIGGSGSVRGKHGDANYRAPECFSADAKTSARADIWSLGAIAYELLAGEGIYSGVDAPDKLPEGELKKIVRKKIRKTPRKTRKFLRKCLEVDSAERYSNGGVAFGELEKIADNLHGWKSLKKTLKRGALGLAATAIITYGSYKTATHEPIELTIPTPQNLQGVLYKPGEAPEGMIEFTYEDTRYEKPPKGMLFSGKAEMAKRVTDNRIVAYLLKCHAQTSVRSPGYSKHQWENYRAHTQPNHGMHINNGRYGNLRYGNPWLVWAKSIEIALGYGKTKNGMVDLEDVMAVARVGPKKVMEAKRIAGEDFRDYCTAKDNNGEYVIPKGDQNFIETWRSFYHADTQ